MRNEQLSNQIDWWLIIIYLALVTIGWLSIYAADYDPDTAFSIFNTSQSSGKQLIWIGTAFVLILVLFALDFRLFESLSYITYLVMLIFLILVLLFGKEVAGNKAWLQIGPFGFQPSEFAKLATALALSRYFSSPIIKLNENKVLLKGAVFILLPMFLILLQPDVGSSLVFFSFALVFFRIGMSPLLVTAAFSSGILFILTLLIDNNFLITGIVIFALLMSGIFVRNTRQGIWVGSATVMAILLVVSVEFVLNDVLREHQRKRVQLLVNPNADPLGVGWNTTQSKIAIGSGGFLGKGFLEGTQTKFDFVPAQTTDFIFCTIGEEHGWIGSTLLIILFGALLMRIVFLAERQKTEFVRIYGYCVAGIIFFHFAINVGMTIGLFPVIGIPLPFISYGGSSLWSFTLLLFIFIKLDAHRMEVLNRI